MTFLDFLSPVLRRPLHWISIFLLTGAVLLSLYSVLPPIEKYTIFFTVKPVAAEEKSFLNDGVESAEKIAEMIAGWAKDPNFQQEVLKIAEVDVSGLKRKMAARKQNRLNVFWTVNLSGKDLEKADALLAAIQTLLKEEIEQTNIDSVIPIKITDPKLAVEPLTVPLSWVLIAVFILSVACATIIAYVRESFRGYISFVEQVYEIFPESAVLRINEKIAKHDQRQMNDFIETFELPRLVSTFPIAGKYFEVTPLADCMKKEGTPLLLVHLGKTKRRELQNLNAILGDGIGIIVFEK